MEFTDSSLSIVQALSDNSNLFVTDGPCQHLENRLQPVGVDLLDRALDALFCVGVDPRRGIIDSRMLDVFDEIAVHRRGRAAHRLNDPIDRISRLEQFECVTC